MEADAEVYYHKSSRIYIADVKSSFMYFYGRDKYENSGGHMFIKLFFSHSSCWCKRKSDRSGSFVEVFGEIVCHPSRWAISWEEIIWCAHNCRGSDRCKRGKKNNSFRCECRSYWLCCSGEREQESYYSRIKAHETQLVSCKKRKERAQNSWSGR